MRQYIMRLLLLAAITATGILLGATVPGGAADSGPQNPEQQQTTTQSAPKPERLRNGCDRLFTQHQFKRYTRAVYRRDQVSRRAKKRVKTMMRCQHSPKAERKMRVFRRQQAADRRARLAVYALTPYGPCHGGRWAVPCSVVGCESGGSWAAYNPSSAAGPYQIMGMHGRPFPVRTAKDRLRHHQIASRLWAGGRGASHWVCK